MISVAEAALVIVLVGLAIRIRTLTKEKNALFKELCRIRDREPQTDRGPVDLQVRQKIAEVARINTPRSPSRPNVRSSPSFSGRWTYESQNSSCLSCGSTEFEMRTYGGPWEYADTHCAQCGKLVRRYDEA